jgi:hypothetical protein
MRLSAIAAASLLAVASAAPAAEPAADPSLESRQGCTYGFVFARGSTEPSPLVRRVWALVCSQPGL